MRWDGGINGGRASVGFYIDTTCFLSNGICFTGTRHLFYDHRHLFNGKTASQSLAFYELRHHGRTGIVLHSTAHLDTHPHTHRLRWYTQPVYVMITE
jgi:hypothetical protein